MTGALILISISTLILLAGWLIIHTTRKPTKPIRSSTYYKPSVYKPEVHKPKPTKPIDAKKVEDTPSKGKGNKTKDRLKSRHRKKLLSLVNSDENIANRLVDSITAKYPDKSTDWCYERAIDDLLRDRQ